MHYEDDYFHPNALDDNWIDAHIDDQYSNAGSEAVSQYTELASVHAQKKRQNSWEVANVGDKEFHRLKYKQNGATVYIELYSTKNTPGHLIRDATSGSRIADCKVGSAKEEMFFKVKIATGEVGSESLTFFFNSPEHYERHMKGTISQPAKEAWTTRCVGHKYK